jgi:high-affinity iron transporter
MLINAVVMFLREFLPLLLLLSVLLFWLGAHWRWFFAIFASSSVFGILGLTSQFSRISALLDGQGLELLYAALYLLTALLLGLALHFSQRRGWCIVLAAMSSACLSLIHGANLVLYLWFYQHTPAESQSLLLGAAMGIGIGLSVAVLLYYLVLECQRYWRWSLALLLALLGARQIGMAVAIFIQTDYLPAGAVLWDSQQLIDEQSEYGYFLNALLGYEATPGVSLLLAMVVSVLLLLVLGRRLEVQHARDL